MRFEGRSDGTVRIKHLVFTRSDDDDRDAVCRAQALAANRQYVNTWRIELKICQTQRWFIAEQGGAPSPVLGNVATGREEICPFSSATLVCAYREGRPPHLAGARPPITLFVPHLCPVRHSFLHFMDRKLRLKEVKSLAQGRSPISSRAGSHPGLLNARFQRVVI